METITFVAVVLLSILLILGAGLGVALIIWDMIRNAKKHDGSGVDSYKMDDDAQWPQLSPKDRKNAIAWGKQKERELYYGKETDEEDIIKN